jgi:hypothetical protein
MTAKLRARTGGLRFGRPVTMRRAAATIPSIREPIQPASRKSAGRLGDCGAEMKAAVGVPVREIVKASVAVCAELICLGLKAQVSQDGSAAPVSPFIQKNETVPVKLLGFTVTVKLALGFAAVKLAEVGETEPGELVPAMFIEAATRWVVPPFVPSIVKLTSPCRAVDGTEIEAVEEPPALIAGGENEQASACAN